MHTRRFGAAMAAVSAVTAVLMVAEVAPAGGTVASADAVLVERLNALRASRGVAPVSVDPELSSVARSWAARMAAERRLSHNGQLASQAPPRWVSLGEAVGAGTDANSVHGALVASPTHSRTMTDAQFDAVGVGTAVAEDGQLFATLDFLSSGTPAKASPAKASPAKAKRGRVRPRATCKKAAKKASCRPSRGRARARR